MTTVQPEPNDSSVEDHVQVSHQFLEHAKVELQKGHLLQASEKVWGATAHALKAIAVQRGWRHRSHAIIFDIGEHLGREFGQEEQFARCLDRADAMHTNFYENNRNESAIRLALADVEQFVEELDRVRTAPPRPFTVRDNDDRLRLGHILGLPREDWPQIGDNSSVGYSLTYRSGEGTEILPPQP